MTSDPALPADAERPGEDVWESWARCGERAVGDALRCTWGEAYEIGVDGGQWWFRRKDGIGGIETAVSPDCLLAQIVIDYDCLPVRCAASGRGAHGFGIPPSGRPVDGRVPAPSPSSCGSLAHGVDVMNSLSQLSAVQLAKAYEAADYLCGVKDALDAELAIKLDTLRADFAAAIEDGAPVDHAECRAAETG
ncbi:MAG TPA: hypothetical protein VKV02_13360 [Acidobacteriaceae bacterium]|nr:hypothetical protein [Acidobacteriaceae bacterium]